MENNYLIKGAITQPSTTTQKVILGLVNSELNKDDYSGSGARVEISSEGMIITTRDEFGVLPPSFKEEIESRISNLGFSLERL